MQGHPGWQGGGWQQPQQPHYIAPAQPAGPPPPWANLLAYPGPFPAIQHFPGTLVYQQRAPLDHVAAEMGLLRGFDAQIEKERSKYGWTSFWFFAGVVVFGLAALAFPPIALLALVSLIVAIVYVTKWSGKKAVDLENRRYELAARLLELLRRDMAAGQPVALHMDLRACKHPHKLRQSYKVDPWTIERYADDWLWLRATLGDGTEVTLTMSERRTVKSGWKSNYRGKMKHKSKTKSRHLLGVELEVSTKKLPRFDEIAASAQRAVQLPPYAVARRMTARGGNVDLRAELAGEWQEAAPGAAPAGGPRPSVAFAAMLLSAYQPVQLCRQMHRKDRKAG